MTTTKATKTETTIDTASARARLQQIRTELKAAFRERAAPIDGLLTAILAREHVLLLGQPGTAKSALANAVCESIDGAKCFGWLLTKFSTPDEVFGPMSVQGLREDRYRRNVAGKLPEAHVSFLDETFKANSSILNALLTIVNERTYHNDVTMQCPLVTLVGASNEMPESEALDALYDRFMLRYWVEYISDRDALKSMLGNGEPKTTTKITLAELEAMQAEAAALPVDDATLDLLLDVKAKAEADGFRSSDRRWRKLLNVLRARAYLEGDAAVTSDAFDVLCDALWVEPKQRPAIRRLVGEVANPLKAKATEVLDAAKEVVASVPAAKGAERSVYLTAVGKAKDELRKMQKMLRGLSGDGAPNRHVAEAIVAVEAMERKIVTEAQRELMR